MIQEESYRKKFELLQPWSALLIEPLKKDLKQEHLRKELHLAQKYFYKKSIDKVTTEELIQAYFQEILSGNEEVGEWIASRWMLKNAEVYHFFVQKLSEINPQFDQIELIPDEIGRHILEEAVQDFGASITYIFGHLNCVCFSSALYQELKQRAEQELVKGQDKQKAETAETSIEKVEEKYQEEIRKLKDKYEKKLLGFQKKYTQDLEGLKKQIKQLQRKLG